MSHLPDEVVKESPAYRQVERDLVALQAEAERAKNELEAVQAEAASLREKQDEFRSAVMVRIRVHPAHDPAVC